LARLAASADVLLLSATPIHNRREDLAALLALFLGARGAALDDAALARCVVRRSRSEVGTLAVPRVDGPHSLVVEEDDAIPEAILALPPALPAADAGAAHALLLVTMIRQWGSSNAALRGGIRRRLAAACALEASLAAGRHPTRSELAAWSLGDDAQQLALPELLSPTPSLDTTHVSLGELAKTVRAHAMALRSLDALAAARAATDARRAELLTNCWRAERGARLLAFAQFAETVQAYWRALRHLPGVCALTAGGARIASGAIARDEALTAFSPRGDSISASRRIDALLATDLASEGLDLQVASVLVHLDLPWTPARLEQRVGRVVRPGAPNDRVRVYVMEPPARAAALTSIRERLSAKLTAARVTLGPVMPGVLDRAERLAESGDRAPPRLGRDIERVVGRWAGRHPSPDGDSGAVRVAAARPVTGERGWLAIFAGDPPLVAASLRDRVGAELGLIAEAVRCAGGEEIRVTDDDIRAALDAAIAWRDGRWAAALAGVPDIGIWGSRRGALRGVAALATESRSRRARDAIAAAHVRALATGRLGAGAERELRSFSRRSAEATRGDWLDAVGAIPGNLTGGATGVTEQPRLEALLVILPR
ncbi:MAG TPA: helicase-related protein, partial [Gemmatimonadaceae bacterium]|nr:helicase-related protein [Gemmatimonadaceae bacterium]